MAMTYVDYIHQIIKKNGCLHQEPFYLEQLYDMGRLRSIPNPYFQRSIDNLTGIPLTRDYVRSTFSRSFYTGFVAAMLWGGLGKTSWIHLVKAMTTDKPEVECKINRLDIMLANGCLREAFHSLQRIGAEDNKLPGVGISYYTKLLFFLNERKEIQPIIFDKWGTYIHAGLLISQGESDRLRSFYQVGSYGGNVILRCFCNRKTDYSYAIYADYLQRMTNLSKELMLDNPGTLEEFLFGKSLKLVSNRTNENPRFFVRNYINSTLMPNRT